MSLQKAEPAADSIGIAKAIVEVFFTALNEDRAQAVSFFGDDGTLFFQGDTVTGKDDILEYLNGLPNLSIRITGYEVQTVPQSDLWSIVIVIGTSQIGDENSKTFHSSAFVEARTSDQTAFIRYFSFTSFD